jgi:uncharacterized damage-inducible protein DinB
MSSEFIDASRHFLLNEYLPKIRLAIRPLSDADIWWRPAADSNSIGNLLLHIEGNARQWLLGGVAQLPNARDRDGEFAATSGHTGAQLVEQLAATLHRIDQMLEALDPTRLSEARTIQGDHTTVFRAIYHVVEHVSMHTGQIIQIAKWRAPGAIRFYEATSDSFTPLWDPELPSG